MQRVTSTFFRALHHLREKNYAGNPNFVPEKTWQQVEELAKKALAENEEPEKDFVINLDTDSLDFSTIRAQLHDIPQKIIELIALDGNDAIIKKLFKESDSIFSKHLFAEKLLAAAIKNKQFGIFLRLKKKFPHLINLELFFDAVENDSITIVNHLIKIFTIEVPNEKLLNSAKCSIGMLNAVSQLFDAEKLSEFINKDSDLQKLDEELYTFFETSPNDLHAASLTLAIALHLNPIWLLASLLSHHRVDLAITLSHLFTQCIEDKKAFPIFVLFQAEETLRGRFALPENNILSLIDDPFLTNHNGRFKRALFAFHLLEGCEGRYANKLRKKIHTLLFDHERFHYQPHVRPCQKAWRQKASLFYPLLSTCWNIDLNIYLSHLPPTQAITNLTKDEDLLECFAGLKSRLNKPAIKSLLKTSLFTPPTQFDEEKSNEKVKEKNQFNAVL